MNTSTKTKPRKTKTPVERTRSSLTNGETVWKCPECNQGNHEPEPACLKNGCPGFRPDLTDELKMLCIAMEPTEEAREGWVGFRNKGVSDASIESRIAAILDDIAGDMCSTDFGPVAWQVTNRRPQLFFQFEQAPERGTPSLAGKKLIAAVRELYAIPKPAGRSKPKPATPPSATDATNGAPLAPESDPTNSGEACMKPISFLKVSKGANPRKHFDKDAMALLVKSIDEHGIIEPIIIRQNGEIVAGERRWRAAKQAGLKQVPVMMREISDEQAATIRLVENYVREDLNAIEEAEALQTLTETHGITQRDLAAELNISQGQIANRIRLLQLPAEWRERVISQEIPPTHARLLIPWVNYPTVLEEIAKSLKRDGVGSVRDFENLLYYAIDEVSRPGVANAYPYAKFKFTKSVKAELDIVEVKNSWGKKIPKAMNAQRWDELQKAAESKSIEREETRPANGKAAKPTRAELKKRAVEQEKQFAKRLYRWKIGWLQQLLAARIDLVDDGEGMLQVLKCVLHFSVQASPQTRGAELAKVVTKCGGKKKEHRRGYYSYTDVWSTLSTIADADLPIIAKGVLKAWLCHPFEGSSPDITGGDVESIADEFGIDVKREWNLTRDFLELHTKDRLQELVTFWKMKIEAPKRGDLIIAILDAADGKKLKCPDYILDLKRPDGF